MCVCVSVRLEPSSRQTGAELLQPGSHFVISCSRQEGVCVGGVGQLAKPHQLTVRRGSPTRNVGSHLEETHTHTRAELNKCDLKARRVSQRLLLLSVGGSDWGGVDLRNGSALLGLLPGQMSSMEPGCSCVSGAVKGPPRPTRAAILFPAVSSCVSLFCVSSRLMVLKSDPNTRPPTPRCPGARGANTLGEAAAEAPERPCPIPAFLSRTTSSFFTPPQISLYSFHSFAIQTPTPCVLLLCFSKSLAPT